MAPTLILGIALGAVLGVAAAFLPGVQIGPLLWIPVFGTIGGFQAAVGAWILRQSHDIPKMRAALPLSGVVLASLACVLASEPFLGPVSLAFGLGVLLSIRLAALEPTNSA